MTGTELRDWRREHGLSMESLAHRLGVSKDTVRRWELKEAVPAMVALALVGVDKGE